jgi:hypothetical protein
MLPFKESSLDVLRPLRYSWLSLDPSTSPIFPLRLRSLHVLLGIAERISNFIERLLRSAVGLVMKEWMVVVLMMRERTCRRTTLSLVRRI